MYCKSCGREADSWTVEFTGKAILRRCRHCGGGGFSTTRPTLPEVGAPPAVAWALTDSDRRFLRSMRIVGE